MLEEREHATSAGTGAKVGNPSHDSLYSYGEEQASSRHVEHQAT